MNEVEWLKSLDRPEPAAPFLDVTAGVMRAVRFQPIGRDDDRVFPIAAAVAAMVGVAAGAMVGASWSAPSPPASPSDPFAGFGEVVNLVLR